MTTLPQTTIRPPQAVGLSSHLPTVTVSAGSPAQMTGRDIWRVIRNNIWLIIILMILFGAGGYALNMVWAKKWPTYTAKAMLQIQTKVIVDPLKDSYETRVDGSRVVAAQRTHQAQLTSNWLVAEVLRKRAADLEKSNWYRQFRSDDGSADTVGIKKYIGENFRASVIPDSDLVEVSFKCADPEDCVTILKTMVNFYVADQSDSAGRQLQEQSRLLGERAKSVTGNLRDVASRIERGRASASELPVTEIKLRALVDTRMKLAADLRDAEQKAAQVKAAVESGESIPDVDRMLSFDPTVSALERTAIDLELQALAKSMNFLEGSKEYQNTRKLADSVAAQLKAQKQKLRAEYQTNALRTTEADAKQKRQDYDKLSADIATLEDQLRQMASRTDQLRSDEAEERTLRDQSMQIQDKSLLLASLLSSGSQAPVKLVGTIEKPDGLTWPQLKMMLPLSMMLGLFIALGIAFLREMLDDTVRTPRDVSRVGQMNLLGIIADSADDPQAEDARLAIFDAPHSLTAEQFRQVRTRLAQAASLETVRSILITGPSPLDGKTTVAANLAAGLALNGRKILLVDANFHRPDLHRVCGLDNERGFSDVLNGAAVAEAAKATRIPNLTVLTSGAKPANATELLESQLLADFIENASQEYDHVIFDSGPLLIVSDAAALAPRVDGVLSVVRAHSESRGLLLRLRDALRQLKAEHIGVVLNAVRSRSGGYYRRNIKAYYKYQRAR